MQQKRTSLSPWPYLASGNQRDLHSPALSLSWSRPAELLLPAPEKVGYTTYIPCLAAGDLGLIPYLNPVLVGHHVGVGHYQAIFWHNEARPAGHRYLTLREHHPDRVGTAGIIK